MCSDKIGTPQFCHVAGAKGGAADREPPLWRVRGFDSIAMKRTGAKTNERRPAGCSKHAPLAAAVFGLFLVQAAVAEEARQAPSAAPAQQQEPGFFESIGRWFERGIAGFKSGIGNAKTGIDSAGEKAANAGKDIGEKAAEVGKGAADATKGAVDAMKKLPATRVVDGHERCDVAPNGAPDCRAAATLICTTKGYASGTSVDFVAAEKCPTAVWMNRRKPEPGECVTETFVTRAMCQ
jgi:hypothetical protein